MNIINAVKREIIASILLSFLMGAMFSHIFGPFEARETQYRFTYLDKNTKELFVTPWSDSREKIDKLAGDFNSLSKEMDANLEAYTEKAYIVRPRVLPFW